MRAWGGGTQTGLAEAEAEVASNNASNGSNATREYREVDGGTERKTKSLF